MNLKTIFIAAGISLAAFGAAAPASAHDGGRYSRHYDNDHRRDHRDWRDHRRWERDHRHYGWRGPRCRTEWRWGHRVRVCR